ncbi:MAG: AAA family ATPase [Bacteroidales bacterium]|nr:AAA family ATPase [Bacteroidales bacterium]
MAIITLCGFMGCGKSSIGALLGRQGYYFIDLDSCTQERCGLSIPQIFSQKGEEHFREQEHNALLQLLENLPIGNNPHTVIALGGGTPTYKPSYKILAEKTFCIYLKCSPLELTKRIMNDSHSLQRPIIQRVFEQLSKKSKAESSVAEQESALLQFVTKSLAEREKFYLGSSKAVIETTSLSPEQVVKEVLLVIRSIYY